jgi:branched-subunit amino acid ABC-type transport system permease component
LRNSVVAAIGGLVVGHILWLIAISLAMDMDEVSTWVLVVAAVVVVGGAVSVYFARKFQQRKVFVKAAFLWCLPILPVLMTIGVLGDTYL